MQLFHIRRKAAVLVMGLLLTASFCACNAVQQPEDSSTPTEVQLTEKYKAAPDRKVIIDTDTGADDACALRVVGPGRRARDAGDVAADDELKRELAAFADDHDVRIGHGNHMVRDD